MEIIFKVSRNRDRIIDWKRYAKQCKAEKKAAARTAYLQRRERIRESAAAFEKKQLGTWTIENTPWKAHMVTSL